jgi:hypothetical protein
MGATAWIRRLVAEMPDHFVFTTRILIGLGRRSAVDTCLNRMVETRTICRLARGVYAKGATPPVLSPARMAAIKAGAFEKQIVEHPSITAQNERLIPQEREQLVFATNGSSSSSFVYGGKRIHLKAISGRKRNLREHGSSRLLHALWYVQTLGNVDIDAVVASRSWGTLRQREIGTMASRVPHWLLDKVPLAPQFVYDNSRSIVNPNADYYVPVYLGRSGMGPTPWPNAEARGHDSFEPHPGHDRWDDLAPSQGQLN